MDVITKRALWQFLKDYKKDKIIILTTHSLDEAEYLGDRIGIMKEGQYICSGTSSYLKNKYSCGYNINLILNPDKFTKENKDNFLNEVKNIYPEYNIKISSKGLLSISCEIIDERTLEIFNYIDNCKNNIGIEDYTIATTSLEDVFLKLNLFEKNKNENEEEINEGLVIQNNLNNESSSFKEQLYENVNRNLITLWRNKITLIFEIITGISVLLIYLIIYTIINFNKIIGGNYTKLSNQIYVDNKAKKYFENSYFTKNKSFKISFEDLKIKPTYNNSIQSTLNSFKNEFYNNSKYKNEKIALFTYEDEKNLTFFVLYQKRNYYYKKLIYSLALSAYFSTLNINVTIFDEYLDNYQNRDGPYDNDDFLYYVIVLLVFSSISYSGNLLNQIVQEREINIKHLITLSGGNLYSYWIGIFIVDMIKYLMFLVVTFIFLLLI